mgnify:CR=1 FL=1
MKKLLILLSLFFVIGCSGNYKDPDLALPAKKVQIRSLLSHPSIFDERGVIVKGKVWDLEYVNLEFTMAKFKLADKSGNHVDVYSKELIKVVNGNLVEVRGIFERNFDLESNMYEAKINSKEIKVLSDSR